MCLKEGLSETELNICQVRTVGEKRLLKRKIAELVGRPHAMLDLYFIL